MKKKIDIKSYGADNHTVYLSFEGHTHEPGIVRKTISIYQLIQGYNGPQINIDFNENGQAIGIEVLEMIGDEDSSEQ